MEVHNSFHIFFLYIFHDIIQRGTVLKGWLYYTTTNTVPVDLYAVSLSETFTAIFWNIQFNLKRQSPYVYELLTHLECDKKNKN